MTTNIFKSRLFSNQQLKAVHFIWIVSRILNDLASDEIDRKTGTI